MAVVVPARVGSAFADGVTGAVITGAVGAVASIVTASPVEATETLPAASVAFAVSVAAPAESVPVVALQAPETLAVTLEPVAEPPE